MESARRFVTGASAVPIRVYKAFRSAVPGKFPQNTFSDESTSC